MGHKSLRAQDLGKREVGVAEALARVAAHAVGGGVQARKHAGVRRLSHRCGSDHMVEDGCALREGVNLGRGVAGISVDAKSVGASRIDADQKHTADPTCDNTGVGAFTRSTACDQPKKYDDPRHRLKIHPHTVYLEYNAPTTWLRKLDLLRCRRAGWNKYNDSGEPAASQRAVWSERG